MLTVKNLLTNNMLKVTYLFLVIIIKYNIQKHFEKTKTFHKKKLVILTNNQSQFWGLR